MLALLALSCSRSPCAPVAWRDADGDGHGDPAAPRCEAGPGTAPAASDCDDGDDSVFPGADERCDHVDQDCDGFADDHPVPAPYLDRDGDGFGSTPLESCDAWAVTEGGDCDDDDPALHPDTPWYRDDDGDGVGAEEVARSCEDPGGGAVRAGGDCDDADATRHPGAREVCGGPDLDCSPGDEDEGAWHVADAAARIPLTVSAAEDVPLAVVLDGLGAGVRVFVQGCADVRELPATVVSDGDPWLAGEGEGDLLVALWDEDGDLDTVEPWPVGSHELAVYVGGSEGPAWSSALGSGDAALGTPGIALAFDAARGGLLSAVDDPAETVAGQAQATAGNGLRTTAGPLSAAEFAGTTALRDADAITAAVDTHTTAEDAAGQFSYDASWRVFAGRAAALGRLSLVAEVTTAIEGTEDRTEPLRPLQLATPLSATCASDAAGQWGDLSDGDRGLTWVWAAPPRWTNAAACGAGETWAAANDLPEGDPGRGPTGTIPAGQAVVDGAVVALLPHGPGGPSAVASRREAWARGPAVTVGAREE